MEVIILIKDLQQFGKWLNENNQVDFGKNVREDDYIFTILFENGKFVFDSIALKNECNLNYFEKSEFNMNLFHSTDQTVIIPSKSNLLGFSPFFIKLDHDFLKKSKLDDNKVKKFKNKIERSLKANRNGNEFIKIVNEHYDNFDELFLNVCPFNEDQKNNLKLILNNSKKEIINLILNYYAFLYDNYNVIIKKIIDFKNSDKYNNKKGNFYLTCVFEDSKDLLNDFFYNYSKFLKLRSEKYSDYLSGKCSICGNKTITYPPLPYYSIMSKSSFNFTSNVANSKLRLCKNCSSFIRYSDDKLANIINMNSIIIVPKIRNEFEYDSFLKIANQDVNSFEKLNNFLKNCTNFNFDLLIVNEDKSKGVRTIKKYIENYKAFLVKFENLYLYDSNKFKYLFDEFSKIPDDKKIHLKDTFSFGNIFKEFFYEVNDDNNFKFPNLYYFHEIYTKDLTGKTGIFNNFKSKTVSIFSKYSENIFNFIYEVNLDALNKKMINEIVLNSLTMFQKMSFGEKNFKFDILKRLNYYFMFKKEFLSDDMLSNENVKNLKRIFGNPIVNNENKDEVYKVSFNENDKNEVELLIKNDVALKYYLLGQFISYIDGFKLANNKKANVFSNFISNVNRNNIKKLFVNEVLQKNNFYISKMNAKGKSIFEIFELDCGNLFDESDNFDYEDYLLLIFTGYYTQNILVTKYKFEEELN